MRLVENNERDPAGEMRDEVAEGGGGHALGRDKEHLEGPRGREGSTKVSPLYLECLGVMRLKFLSCTVSITLNA